jgi:uncharacterized protein (TIGR02001 family)
MELTLGFKSGLAFFGGVILIVAVAFCDKQPNQTKTTMIKKTILALAALGAGVSVYAAEKANAVSFTLDNTIVSEYIFRGKEFGDYTFQPSIEAKYGDFYAGVWAALPENSANDEIDVYAGYSFAVNETISLDAGLTYYHYTPASDTSTFEPFIGANAKVAGFNLGLYYYYDLQIEDATIEGSVGYSLPIEAIGTSLDFSANLGYVSGDGYESPAANVAENYTYYSFGVAVPYKVSENATVTVGAKYSDVSRNAINGAYEVTYSAGLSIGF